MRGEILVNAKEGGVHLKTEERVDFVSSSYTRMGSRRRLGSESSFSQPFDPGSTAQVPSLLPPANRYVDIPVDTEFQQGCIWRQARGSATQVSGIEDVRGSSEKVPTMLLVA
ncbi:hypothetical protein ACE6H2_028013 [Prunus campanulata]